MRHFLLSILSFSLVSAMVSCRLLPVTADDTSTALTRPGERAFCPIAGAREDQSDSAAERPTAILTTASKPTSFFTLVPIGRSMNQFLILFSGSTDPRTAEIGPFHMGRVSNYLKKAWFGDCYWLPEHAPELRRPNGPVEDSLIALLWNLTLPIQITGDALSGCKDPATRSETLLNQLKNQLTPNGPSPQVLALSETTFNDIAYHFARTAIECNQKVPEWVEPFGSRFQTN